MINLSSENGVDSFVRLMNLRCGMTYFGEKCIMFIVSIVSDKEMESLAGNETSHRMNDNDHQRFSLFEHNQHDPHVMGTVVFRGHPFPKICQLGKDEVSLIMESYPTLFS